MQRLEKDSLGNVLVPSDVYYGSQTQRAINNFPISGLQLQKKFIESQAIIKLAAAKVNIKLKHLNPKIGNAIIKASQEILNGKLLNNFLVDVYQAGAGTSQNMNMNEVLANRALEILKEKRGNYKIIHPNDHVNMSQSTNDTIPTAIHISCFRLSLELKKELSSLYSVCKQTKL
ncbi:MAG: hypothetical protein GY830_01050 [Bacteroidetes bacterium]|nr:hypothetical protein [Bacteroidota bacterium]